MCVYTYMSICVCAYLVDHDAHPVDLSGDVAVVGTVLSALLDQLGSIDLEGAGSSYYHLRSDRWRGG